VSVKTTEVSKYSHLLSLVQEFEQENQFGRFVGAKLIM